jgi:5'-nucleotidase
LTVRQREDLFDCPAWDVDGTPADCVNLGLGHLIRGRIDAVVSGINMGSNVSLPLILCSGTVGGALEGSFHGLHAVAASIRIARPDFAAARDPQHPDHRSITSAMKAAAQLTAARASAIARRRKPSRCIVHNLNFPSDTTADTIVERSIPANVRVGTLFQPADEPGVYEFTFRMRNEIPASLLSDRISLEAGHANHSVLDFGRLGVPGGIFGAVPRMAATKPAAS